ncbi:MAG: alpha-amylase family glycosyl hydrolase [Oscillospiraceae bacterium]|nr:alpha-amylase family glycosyl hydrolase [Oscillospiraceae bacterium]
MQNKKVTIILLTLLFVAFLLSGCASGIQLSEHTAANRNFYQIFVGSFYDSDGDGLGDLRGITHKLDYLNNPSGKDTLGVRGIWLSPINPSPTYHKYDVTDYYSIDPAFGTMEDFEELIAEANKRGIDIIIDLVLNHTSSQHPWFLAALDEIRNDKEPFYRDFYNFTETRSGSGYYPTVGGLFYEAHFWSEMPDLNMDNENLRAEIADIAKFWLDKGVAGFRLDAVMHIYRSEAQNLEFWSWFVDVCKEVKDDVFLVGEVWSNEMTIMPYFETGLSLFNFPFANHDGTINKAVSSGNGERLAQEIERYAAEIYRRSPSGINCVFLSNHDTGRSAGFLIEPEKKKLAAAIYLMIPGNPFIYYGEEIGMTGAGIDENKRTAMFWSNTDKTGITRNPHNTTNNRTPEFGVSEQFDDPDSLLSYYRQILALKSKHPDIFDGRVTWLNVENSGICAIQTGDVVVMHNLTDESIEVALPVSGVKMSGFLSPTGEVAKLSGDMIFIPPYATAVLG